MTTKIVADDDDDDEDADEDANDWRAEDDGIPTDVAACHLIVAGRWGGGGGVDPLG
jgi:hypothetical protein